MLRFVLLCAVALAVAACDATNEVPGVGQAGPALAIDALRITTSGADTVVVSGIGSGTPVASDTIEIDAGAAVSAVVRPLDAALDAEVQAEAESYLFRFSPSTDGLVATPTDRESVYTTQNLNDGDYPLGRSFRLVASAEAAGEATLTVSLVRYDGAPKSDGAGTGGVEDLSVAVPVVIVADDG